MEIRIGVGGVNYVPLDLESQGEEGLVLAPNVPRGLRDLGDVPGRRGPLPRDP